MRDLLFKSKIEAAAQVVRQKIVFADDSSYVENPEKIIVDLDAFPVDEIQEFVFRHPQTKIIGFVSHKNESVISRARKVGITVFSRSLFVQKLPTILRE